MKKLKYLLKKLTGNVKLLLKGELFQIAFTVVVVSLMMSSKFKGQKEYPSYKLNPLKLQSYIECTQEHNMNVVSWGCTQSYDYFLVEKSCDKAAFAVVGKVKTTKNLSRHFVFIDNTPSSGNKVYYRIKKCSKSGFYEYSGIVSVAMDNRNQELQEDENIEKELVLVR